MSRNSVIDDATLLEYLDDTLAPPAHRAVEAALAESPELTERLTALRALVPLIDAALVDAAVPVPPAPTLAAIKGGASERQTRLFGAPSSPKAPLAVAVQARDLALLLAGVLILVIVSLATFLMDNPAAIIIVGVTTLLLLGLFRAFEARRARRTSPPAPDDLPTGGWRRRVVAVSSAGAGAITVTISGGLRISVLVSPKRMRYALMFARGLAEVVQLGVTLFHLIRMLGI